MSVQFLLMKYMRRVKHMKHMREELAAMRRGRHHLARRMELAQEEAIRLARELGTMPARLKRWRKVAIVAVLACPGSFVAGGYVLGKVFAAVVGG